ncbi:MAG: hypothetical protein LBD01_05785 [Puniceicoccales bacterium]|jgi:hypothetical protein|nr:hypothetical protein [Puniceicoccales bacterium]
MDPVRKLLHFFPILLGMAFFQPGISQALGQPLPPAVSDSVKLICGAVPASSYDVRIRTVGKLGRTLPADDFFALQNFLEKKPKDDPAKPDQLDAIKNDVAAKLIACDYWPDGFARRFLAMHAAPDVGLVWQNYTIQFLDSLWRRERDDAVRRQILDALIEAGSDTRITMSGTALLTLSRLPSEAGLGAHELGAMAVRVIGNTAIPWQDKITALHVAADAADARALAQARIWAVDKTQPIMLRMASFAVMGKRGDASDKPLLERYAQSGEFRLRTASRAALKKLSQPPAP